MKLLRYGPKGNEKPAVVDAHGKVRCLSSIIDDINGDALNDDSLIRIASLDYDVLPEVAVKRFGPCVGQVGKFVCIGLNYSDHAKEAGMDLPSEPVVFSKATSSICGANDNIEIPRGASKTDWEIELGVVIGKTAKYVEVTEALDYVAGYCIVNDVSERDFQLSREGQWIKGKSADTFGPIGPWLVTRDEVHDPQNLSMQLDVNGVRMQDGSTKTMAFSVAYIVSYLSQFMSLQAGDIIATGTPPGVGLGMTPEPVFLKPGDKIESSIEGLGNQTQHVVKVH